MKDQTIGKFFEEKTESYGANLFLLVPEDQNRSYHSGGFEISYVGALETVRTWQSALRDAGYGAGFRVRSSYGYA